jgi:hypothetical protein
MSVKNGQLVRLYDSSSVAIENIVSGSTIVAGIKLPGLGYNDSDWENWVSTDISSLTIESSEVVSVYPYSSSSALEINGNLVVSHWETLLIKNSVGEYKFISANDITLHEDSLVKYENGIITEELITSVYTLTDQSLTSIDIEAADVYLVNNYIIHNEHRFGHEGDEGGDEDGAEGPEGPAGAKGAKGDNGALGNKGVTGGSGVPGGFGAGGAQGAAYAPYEGEAEGAQGAAGAAGAEGPAYGSYGSKR